MALKFTILFLGALLLAQATYSAPTDTSSGDSAEKLLDELANIFKEIADRFKIIEVTIDELLELEELVKEKGKTVLKKVLEDPKVVEVQSDLMQSYLKEIREYLDKLEKGEGDSKNVLEYLTLEELVKKFKKENGENLVHEAEVIGTSLKENGLEELEKTVSEHFLKFTDKFVEQLDAYVQKLNDEDKKDEKILLDWYENFKAEKDLTKKLNIFDDFFVSQSKNSKEESKEE